MSKFKRHLITAALPYANGPLHIGHLAGCYLSADAYARYLRSRKCEVLFICGSDEYGVPISIRALRENCSPQEIVDKYHNSIQQSFAEMGISFDIYTRTTDNLHHQTVQEFFLQIHSRSGFKKIASEQFLILNKICSWQIAIYRDHVGIVVLLKLMEISVKNVVQLYLQRNY